MMTLRSLALDSRGTGDAVPTLHQKMRTSKCTLWLTRGGFANGDLQRSDTHNR
jgi:hypothetical protein